MNKKILLPLIFTIISVLFCSLLISADLNIGYDNPSIPKINIEQPTIITTGGGNISNATLNDLLDVNVPSPADGEVLAYNGTSELWEGLIQAAIKWIVGSSNGYLYNNSDTLFFNDTRINDFYFKKTDLQVNNLGTPTYNRSVQENNVTMTAVFI